MTVEGINARWFNADRDTSAQPRYSNAHTYNCQRNESPVSPAEKPKLLSVARIGHFDGCTLRIHT